MSTSSIIKIECPKCHKVAIEKSRLQFGTSVLIKLACGHSINSESLIQKESAYDSLVFTDGAKPRPYQIDGIKFGEKANLRFILADEQGLGKTIQIGCLIKLHVDKVLPCVIVCPTTIKVQFAWELKRILGNDPKFLTQVIMSGKEKAMPGFGIYIITYDMLKKDDIFEFVDDIKTLVIDECQRIKNHLSDRAKAVQKIAVKCNHIIPMSGTPIKNHAGEYFTVLNLVAPQRFPHYQTFLNRYCDSYDGWYGQKVGGLKDIERFAADTEDIIIRRTKEEVLKDLPPLDRKYQHVELDRKFNKAYAKALEELDELIYGEDSNSFESGAATIAIMAKLRHICGISKVNDCVEFATEFLLSNNRKLVIFTHHQDVADLVKANLDKWLIDGGYEKSLHLHSGLDSTARAALAKKFKENDSNRIMIASTLAAGEGLNLQFCSDAVMLERQWNPANEEQAEARFHRFGQENNVFITYMIAAGTIDEYFTELVEKKRAIVKSALDHQEMNWEQNSLMKELAEILVTQGREKWRL